MGFEEFKLCDAVRRGVEASGFNKPTPVQDQVIPPALKGEDLLVFAETGTGKTAAYGLPILERLSQTLGVTKPATAKGKAGAKGKTAAKAKEGESPEEAEAGKEASKTPVPGAPTMFALILGPTREVVTRSEGALRAFGTQLPARIRAIFGGVPAAPQREALRRGLHIVSATPGRLAEILRNQEFSLDGVKVLVLDELDHLVQMNLMKEVNAIVERLPKERQTYVFANKRTSEVETLAREFTQNPTIIEVARLEAPLENIRQVLYPVESVQKSDLLLDILKEKQDGKAVVFFRTRRSVDRLQPMIEKLDRKVAALHADRTPAKRQQAIEAFSSGEADTLVATEMAVRSLEVEDIAYLINFDLPQFPDDYVNRIARCSQVEPVREVISLVSAEDRDSLRRLEKHLGKTIERVKLPDFEYVDRGRRSVDRVLAPAGGGAEARAATAGEAPLTGRRPRRPSRPAPPVGERVAAVERPAPGEAEVTPEAPESRPVPESTPPPAPPTPSHKPRQRVHPAESLSGRLTRSADRMQEGPSAPAIRKGASPAPERARPAPAAEPKPQPAAAASAASPRPKFTLADEKRSPRVREARPRPTPPTPPEARPSREERRPSREVVRLPQKETPPPVTAGPIVTPLENEPTEHPVGIPTVSFTSSAQPDKAPPSIPLRPPSAPKESELEFEEPLDEEEEELLEEEEEEEAAAQESASAERRKEQGGRFEGRPASRGGRSEPSGGRGRMSRQPDRRPRRIRSWDLHRGGLLESPPLYSTPFDTFIPEERKARKHNSFVQALKDEDIQTAPGEEAPYFETYITQWVPIDWDHPSTRFGRPSRFMQSWKDRMMTIETAQSEAEAGPAGARASSKTARPASAGRTEAGGGSRKDRAEAAGKSGRPPVQPPPLPAWPLAVDSDTSAATAPGQWWSPPEPEDAGQSAEAATPEPRAAKTTSVAKPRTTRGRRGPSRTTGAAHPSATHKPVQPAKRETAEAASSPAPSSPKTRRGTKRATAAVTKPKTKAAPKSGTPRSTKSKNDPRAHASAAAKSARHEPPKESAKPARHRASAPKKTDAAPKRTATAAAKSAKKTTAPKAKARAAKESPSKPRSRAARKTSPAGTGSASGAAAAKKPARGGKKKADAGKSEGASDSAKPARKTTRRK